MPAEVFPLVEIVAGPVTPRAVLDRVAAAMARTDKNALILDRPVAGFLINRLQHALLHEAYALISSGISNAADIDRIARLLLGPRLSVNGVIEQKDIGGLAAHAMAQTTIVPTFDRSGQPNAYLQNLVAKGETGLDAGRGFYDWTGCDVAVVRQRSSKALKKTLAFLAELEAERPDRDRPVDRSPGRANQKSDRGETIMSEPCQPARKKTTAPQDPVPSGACDSHFHIFGPKDRYPYATERNYTPPDASVANYRKLIETLGIERQVIVQPSVYGTDNARTLDALREFGQTCRGVVVIAPETPLAELRAMHDLGVRGVRFNAVTGGSAGVEALEAMAARIAPLGWHIQLFLRSEIYPWIEPVLKRLPVDFVIDHMGQTMTAKGVDDPGFKAVLRLIDQGHGWAKITGAYRISSNGPPYSDSAPFAKALIQAAPDRIVWGTDWPHPDVKGEMPDDGSLLDLLSEWAPDIVLRRRILVDNPARLYGFKAENVD